MLEASKAVELIVWTRDGALVFQETFWQILRCIFSLSAQSYKYSFSSVLLLRTDVHTITQEFDSQAHYRFFPSGTLKCYSAMYQYQ